MSRNTPWRTTRRMYALHQPGVNDWYRIRNQKEPGKPVELHIYDEIGYFGVTASDLVRDLADVIGPLDVHVNSPGGDVWDGIAIYNCLMARQDVTVYIDGIAASIASVIACAGSPVLIARNAQMMIHDGFGQAIGNAQDMRDFAEQLDRASNNIASIYSDRTGRPVSYWRELMKAETWYDAEQAIDAGLADRLIDSGAGRRVKEPQAKWDLTIFRGAASPPYVSETTTRHAPMTGTHTHDHSAHGQPDHDDGMHSHPHTHQNDAHHDHHDAWDPDGDGDDDSNPAGDTDNSHWSADGKQLKSVPGKPLNASMEPIDIQNANADHSPWDAGRAWKNASNSDSPGSFYKGICAGRRSGPSDERSSWALPHHYHPGDAPNAAGVQAALSRINQTEGLTNKSEALAHLQAHMKAINPDYKPDDLADIELSDEEIARIANELKGVL